MHGWSTWTYYTWHVRGGRTFCDKRDNQSPYLSLLLFPASSVETRGGGQSYMVKVYERNCLKFFIFLECMQRLPIHPSETILAMREMNWSQTTCRSRFNSCFGGLLSLLPFPLSGNGSSASKQSERPKEPRINGLLGEEYHSCWDKWGETLVNYVRESWKIESSERRPNFSTLVFWKKRVILFYYWRNYPQNLVLQARPYLV